MADVPDLDVILDSLNIGAAHASCGSCRSVMRRALQLLDHQAAEATNAAQETREVAAVLGRNGFQDNLAARLHAIADHLDEAKRG